MGNRVGFIVDGDGEFAAFEKRFKGKCKVLKTDGPRGETATPDDIVSKARKQIAILRMFKCGKVIMVVDFESRRTQYAMFLKSLEDRFSRAKWGLSVAVSVPNKMIENWYLADVAYLSEKKKFLKKRTKQKNYEGKNGKKELKRCFIKGTTYRETRHGPQLFAILRFPVARKNSASFDRFMQLIGR